MIGKEMVRKKRSVRLEEGAQESGRATSHQVQCDGDVEHFRPNQSREQHYVDQLADVP